MKGKDIEEEILMEKEEKMIIIMIIIDIKINMTNIENLDQEQGQKIDLVQEKKGNIIEDHHQINQMIQEMK